MSDRLWQQILYAGDTGRRPSNQQEVQQVADFAKCNLERLAHILIEASTMIEISEIPKEHWPVRCIISGPVASGKTTFSGMLASAIRADVTEVWSFMPHPFYHARTYHQYSRYLPYEITDRVLFHLQDAANQSKCIIIEEWLRTTTVQGLSSQIENFLTGIKHFSNISILIVSQLIESPFLHDIHQLDVLKPLITSNLDNSLRFSIVRLGKDAIKYASSYFDQPQLVKLQAEKRPCLFDSIPVHFPEKL